MLRKIRFLLNIYKYKFQVLLGLERSDIMSVINDYYRSTFRHIDKKDVAVILPHCLIDDNCPARFSKFDGVICKKCSLCKCGDIYASAEEKGLQFYISPSVGFTRRLVQRKGLRGIIGIACDYEIERGMHSEKITSMGVRVNGSSVKTQGVRLQVYNCTNNSVDWDSIESIILKTAVERP